MESKCKIARSSPFQIDLKLEWPAKKVLEVVTKALKAAYKRLNMQGVPGFRRGKVPQGLFDIRYAHAVRMDAINKMIRPDIAVSLQERSLWQCVYELRNGHVEGSMGLYPEVFDKPLIFVFSAITAPFHGGWGPVTTYFAP